MLFWYWLIILRAGAQQRKYLTRFLFYTLALVTRTCSNISIIHLINLSFTGREVSLPCSFRSTRCLWFDSFDINAVIYLFSWELVWNQLHRSITAIYSKHTQRHIPSNLTFFSIFFWIDRNLTFCRRSIPTTDELFQKGVDDDTTIGKTILLNQLRKQNDTTKIYLLRDNTAILQLRGHLRDAHYVNFSKFNHKGVPRIEAAFIENFRKFTKQKWSFVRAKMKSFVQFLSIILNLSCLKSAR